MSFHLHISSEKAFFSEKNVLTRIRAPLPRLRQDRNFAGLHGQARGILLLFSPT
jgi:hypothetical protein